MPLRSTTPAPLQPKKATQPSKPAVAPAAGPAKPAASTAWTARAGSPQRPAATAKGKTTAVQGPAPVTAPSAGPVSELERQSAVVVSNSDGYAPTRALHEILGKHMPPGARLVVMQGKAHSDAWHGAAPAGAMALKTTTDSPWARDFAPTFVRTREGKLEIVEFKYAYEGSDTVAKSMGKQLGIPVKSSKLALEGGNLLADQGRLFITTKALTANKDLSKTEVEAELKRTLHVDTVEWMKPLPGEATGHVDLYAKQVAPGTMLVSDTARPEHKAVMDEAARKFEALGYKVIRAQNADIKPSAGQPWANPNSYANALVVNGTAFVPQYAAPWDKGTSRGRTMSNFDRQALSAYASAGLKVVAVPAYDLINFQGSVHCMTNAMPEGVALSKLK